MLLAEEKSFFDKEVSILNLLPPGLSLKEMTDCVSTEKTATIKDMMDILMVKSEKDIYHLLYGTFFMLANMIISRDHKTWYVMSLKIAPFIPLYHLEQIKQLLAGIIKLANTPALIKQAMTGKPLDP
eukprot:9571993-Ditylum_brightwellii.AAC.1